MKNRKMSIAVIVILAVLVIAGVVIFCIRQNSSTGQNGQAENQTVEDETATDETYQSLSEADRQSADIYAELYETSREEVAELYIQTNDWEQTGKQLENGSMSRKSTS